MGDFTKYLIIGGTGSFGNSMVQRLIKEDVDEIRILSRDEKKQDEMRLRYKDTRLKFYIGDIRDSESLIDAVEGVEVIFHAAALKQVPSAEFFPLEVVKTNILGTNNVIETSIRYGVKKLILLSTDKAAYPITAMGISKAMMERIAFAKSRLQVNKTTKIIVVRYGNVIGSRGSVIPLFINQIKNQKPITLTDPNMTRFIMSLFDAIDLVFYAINNGESGDLFVYVAPSVKISDLADAVIHLMGSDSGIQIIGPRHSEKTHETLLTLEEVSNSNKLGNFVRIPIDARGQDYSSYEVIGDKKLDDKFSLTSNNTKLLTKEEIIDVLKRNSEIIELLDGYPSV